MNLQARVFPPPLGGLRGGGAAAAPQMGWSLEVRCYTQLQTRRLRGGLMDVLNGVVGFGRDCRAQRWVPIDQLLKNSQAKNRPKTEADESPQDHSTAISSLSSM